MIARFAIPFFFTVGLVIIPAFLALLCRWLLPRRWWRWTALACTLLIWGTVGYGYFIGFLQLRVRHVELSFSDLPAAFDGYRIVQFSDAHVGTLTGSHQWLLQRAVDSINAQRADAIVFTGDLQNLHPDELPAQLSILRQLRAPDGVYSVLGNHDYPMYLRCDSAEKAACARRTIDYERQVGFDLLLNEHRIIRRDSDSIVIAGMENWGVVERMPRRGDVRQTLAGLQLSTVNSQLSTSFIVMLQHDPTAWRERILPESSTQLTLSGHTHGGQLSVFGWSPVELSYREWGGVYHEGARALYVSTGLGGLIPFRLGMPGEIVVITLKSKKTNHKD